jgi:Mn-dependent DtxR family transcriptional regulator
MQLLRDRGELRANQLYPTGKAMIVRLEAKGWIEAAEPETYRLTAAGLAAMKAPIPPSMR